MFSEEFKKLNCEYNFNIWKKQKIENDLKSKRAEYYKKMSDLDDATKKGLNSEVELLGKEVDTLEIEIDALLEEQKNFNSQKKDFETRNGNLPFFKYIDISPNWSKGDNFDVDFEYNDKIIKKYQGFFEDEEVFRKYLEIKGKLIVSYKKNLVGPSAIVYETRRDVLVQILTEGASELREIN